jgi:hypothetical protein
MHIVFGFIWQIEMDHMRYIHDVQTTSRQSVESKMRRDIESRLLLLLLLFASLRLDAAKDEVLLP